MLRDLYIIEFNGVMDGTSRNFEYHDVFMGTAPMMYMINSNGLIDGGQYIYMNIKTISSRIDYYADEFLKLR